MSVLRIDPAFHGRMAGAHADPMLLRIRLHAHKRPRCDDPEPMTSEFGELTIRSPGHEEADVLPQANATEPREPTQ